LPVTYLSLIRTSMSMKYGSLFSRDNNEKRVKITSWSSKLLDASNHWINGVNKEEEKQYEMAAELYIKDAIECIHKESFNKAGLSCTSAAICMSKIGDDSNAQKLFFEAGSLFENRANLILNESISESVWALRQSYENFIMSGDLKKAEEIHDRIIMYATRINPLSGSRELRLLHGMSQITLGKMKYDSAELRKVDRENSTLYATIKDLLNIRSKNVTKGLL
ncbi:MAG: hypothetical protein ABJB85_04415, partial [Nitrososphaerota archaeon]